MLNSGAVVYVDHQQGALPFPAGEMPSLDQELGDGQICGLSLHFTCRAAPHRERTCSRILTHEAALAAKKDTNTLFFPKKACEQQIGLFCFFKNEHHSSVPWHRSSLHVRQAQGLTQLTAEEPWELLFRGPRTQEPSCCYRS